MPSGRYSYPRHVRSRRFLGASDVRRRIRRYLIVLRRYPTYPDGIPAGFGRMYPSLSDCPGMGADVPRRMNRITSRGHLNLPIRTFATDDGDSSPPSRTGLSRLRLRKQRTRCRRLRRGSGPRRGRAVRGVRAADRLPTPRGQSSLAKTECRCCTSHSKALRPWATSTSPRRTRERST